jgi:hypothetical protein
MTDTNNTVFARLGYCQCCGKLERIAPLRWIDTYKLDRWNAAIAAQDDDEIYRLNSIHANACEKCASYKDKCQLTRVD